VQDLQSLFGGVSNEGRSGLAPDTSAISDDITHALNRSWFFDSQTISVPTEAGKASNC
jgi:hypothetical protein